MISGQIGTGGRVTKRAPILFSVECLLSERNSDPCVEPLISFVVPVYNERESLETLFQEIKDAMTSLSTAFEIVFVNDGSTDESADVLKRLAAKHLNVRVIEFRRNFGKAAALDAGFRATEGNIVFTMDADLQDDPAEISNFLSKIDEGYDVVSGWKEVRHDPIGKTLPSKVFNAVVGSLSGVKLNDFNCGFKAYRREALNDLSLYGELHRFIPVLLHWRGFKIGELPVNHRARKFGQSKFGAERLVKGALDLLTVILNTRFQTRPLHIFGGAGIAMGMAGFLILSYLTAVWFTGGGPIGNRPLLFFGILLVLSSFQFFTVGLLGEFIQRQAGQSGRASAAYSILHTHNIDQRYHLEQQIQRLKEARDALKEAEEKWMQQPSETIQASDTPTNMPTKIRSTG